MSNNAPAPTELEASTMDATAIIVSHVSTASEDNASFSGRKGKADEAAQATYTRRSTIGHSDSRVGAQRVRHVRHSLTAPLPSPFQPYSDKPFSVGLEVVLQKKESLPVPGPSPFQPFSQQSFTTPMPKLLEKFTQHSSSDSSNAPEIHDSHGHGKAKHTQVGVKQAQQKAQDQWHPLVASPGPSRSKASSSSSSGKGKSSFLQLFSCFRAKAVV